MVVRMKFEIILIFLVAVISTKIYSQDEPIRVACVGNSITEGIAMSTAAYDSFPVDLDRFLGDDYDVKNFGKSGRTMLKNGDYPLWDEQLFKDAINFDPNIVIILLGTNDTKPQNWVYKDEFLPDYYSMIDTFKNGASNPEIYVCYPPPSFSDAYDIRDSIIVADIIPMISQIVDSLDLKSIDFNTPFLDKSDLMPDGIHPLIEGSDLMARIIYTALTGKTIEMQYENNVALNKKTLQGGNELPQLVDKDSATYVSFNASSEPVVISLSDQYNIDMVQLYFTGSPPDFSFTVSASTDSVEWTTVVDTALITAENFFNFAGGFEPVDANFIRFGIKEGGIEEDSTFFINEIKVLESRPLHAPIISSEFISRSSSSTRTEVLIKRSSNRDEYMKIYRQNDETSPFTLYRNYRPNAPIEVVSVVRFDNLQRFYSVAYADGVEIGSDTLTIISTAPTNINDFETNVPGNYSLSQNYPNPFNPETFIEFTLSKPGTVTIEIYDITGRLIRTLGNKTFSAGNHRLRWDGRNKNGVNSASGVYYYSLKISNKLKEVKKMTLLR